MVTSCPSCGNDAPGGARFCPSCGASVDTGPRCSCGAVVPEGARFCPSCGSATGSAAAPTHAERRPVTVLFADAVGSTAFTERVGDEAAYRLVQDCVALMTGAVERHGGTITQFRGDGIMALFGAPIAQEHSATSAVTAALEMRDALAAYADASGDRGVTCSFRIGLSTGPVVVGRVGDDVLMDYTAIGDTANVAARMESAAEPGTVYVSESTWRAVRQYVECRPVGELAVKGKTAPVVAHEAVRRRPIRTRLEAAVERGLGPFVGRARDLELLLGHVDALAAGRGHVVEVTGEAGIGKSRLLLELRRRLPDGVGWTEGHCSASAADTPYLPIADLLRNAFGIEEQDDPAAVAARVDEASAAWSPEAQGAVPYLKYLLDVDPGGDVLATDARTRRAALLDALRTAVADAGRRQPRVIVVEDVHWADPASLDALVALADVAEDAAVLLLTTSRPGAPSPFPRSSSASRIALDGIAPQAAEEMVARALDAEHVGPEIAALIADKAEGNPLFVEELLATLLERELIVRDDGTWHLAHEREAIDVPGTLQEVILARIDRLPVEARAALQLAAVIGREFTVRLLDRLADLPDRLDEALEELRAVELIRQKTWFPELAYLFKHALTHDVTYATLLDDRRRALHRLVAQAIEEVYADRLVEHHESLARHWLLAEEWDKALRYLELSGDAAMASFANQEAAAFFEQAIAVAERLGSPSKAASLAGRLGDVFMGTGDLPGARGAFDRMARLAAEAGDDEARAWGLTLRGEADAYNHDWDRAEPGLLEALAIRGASAEPHLYAAVFLHTGRTVFGFHDQADEAAQLVDRLTPAGVRNPRSQACLHSFTGLLRRWHGDLPGSVATSDFDPPPGADLLTLQGLSWETGMAQAEMGRYDEGLASLALTIERSERAGEAMFRARAMNTIGWVRGDLGDHDGAVAWNERCLSFLAEVEIPDEEVESNARLNLADTYLDEGRLELAAAQLARVEEIVRGQPVRGTWMLWRYSQHLLLTASLLRLARGEPDAVGSRVDDCLALARESGSRKYEGKAARVAALRHLAANRLDEAEALAADALAVASEIGHPPDRWRAMEVLAAVSTARGDDEAARRHRSEADGVLAEVESGLADPAGRAGVARLRGSLTAQ